MAPRGLKKLLRDSAPCKLVGSGRRRRFEIPTGKRSGLKLRGVTKRLEGRIFSDGELPMIAKRSDLPAGGHWRGPGGGRRRGSAVDAQVSRLAGVSEAKRFGSSMLNLTKMVFSALSVRGLEPLMGQRAVCSQLHRIGTAIDLLCYSSADSSLVVVELKCGFSQGRTAPAVSNGRRCFMNKPLHRAADSTINRHMAQLATTHHLLVREHATMDKLAALGILEIRGLLLYSNDSSVDFYELDSWWTERGPALLNAMR